MIKMSHDGKYISFLEYPEFDENPHPQLKRSVSINIPTGDVKVRSYEKSENPPILHRKETFVDKSYEFYDSFRVLTTDEINMGLLNDPTTKNKIGFKKYWDNLVKEKGIVFKNHEIYYDV